MDRRTLLAITLCFLIYLGWQKLYFEPRFQAEHPQAPTALTNPSESTGNQTQTHETKPSAIGDQKIQSYSAKSTKPVHRDSQKLQVPTSIGQVTLSDSSAFFSGFSLKSYKLGISPEAAAVDMESVTHQNSEVNLAFDDPHFAYLNDVQGNFTRTAQGVVWSYEDENVKLTREFQTLDKYPYVDVRVVADFKREQAPKYAFINLVSQAIENDPEAQDRQLVYWTNQSIERIPLKDSTSLKEISTPVKYIGATNRYFIMTVVAESPMEAKGLIQPLGQGKVAANLVYPVTGKSISIPLRVYFGPKELDLLRQVDSTLDHTVDFGWFTVFAYPLLKILKWFYQFLQNYGLAIIFLTLLLKILTYPLTYKSMKSMKKMAALQPQLQRIREKYKDDREALNREMLTMMRSNGYNPVAGCLPMLIQMPIFFALYRVLYSSIELYHAPFALWIHDLSSRDPFYVTPVLLSVTMFIQQKLTPNTATDPAQAKMMQLMPLIFGAFMLALPSGLTVYMLVNAIASIVQQLILNKKLNAAPAR